jgi:hypothetical protein
MLASCPVHNHAHHPSAAPPQLHPYAPTCGASRWDALFGHVNKDAHMREMFQLTTRLNALARIVLGPANISATTALQAIEPNGREIALRRGANVLMPILTPTKCGVVLGLC